MGHLNLERVSKNDLAKSAKDRFLKIDTDVVICREQIGNPNSVGSATITGSGVSDPEEFLRHLHGVDLNRGLGTDIIVIKALALG